MYGQATRPYGNGTFTMLQVATPKGIKFDVSEEVADQFRAAMTRKKIGYSEGAEALMKWFAAQDGMLQSLILGQIEEDYEGQVARMVLDRWLEESADTGGPSVVASTGLRASSPAAHAKPATSHQESPGGGGSGKPKVKPK